MSGARPGPPNGALVALALGVAAASAVAFSVAPWWAALVFVAAYPLFRPPEHTLWNLAPAGAGWALYHLGDGRHRVTVPLPGATRVEGPTAAATPASGDEAFDAATRLSNAAELWLTADERALLIEWIGEGGQLTTGEMRREFVGRPDEPTLRAFVASARVVALTLEAAAARSSQDLLDDPEVGVVFRAWEAGASPADREAVVRRAAATLAEAPGRLTLAALNILADHARPGEVDPVLLTTFLLHEQVPVSRAAVRALSSVGTPAEIHNLQRLGTRDARRAVEEILARAGTGSEGALTLADEGALSLADPEARPDRRPRALDP